MTTYRLDAFFRATHGPLLLLLGVFVSWVPSRVVAEPGAGSCVGTGVPAGTQTCGFSPYAGDGPCEINYYDCGDGSIGIMECDADTLTCESKIYGQDGPPTPQGSTNPTSSKSPAGGDPVSADGSMNYHETDFTLTGAGIPLTFERTYNSKINYIGPLGYSWDFNFNQQLLRNGPDVLNCDGTIIYHNGKLGLITFVKGPHGSISNGNVFNWVPSDGQVPLVLWYTAVNSTYHIRDYQTNLTYHFSKSGKLVYIDKGGLHRISLLYNSTSVDANSQSRLGEISDDETKRAIYLQYQGNFLSKVCASTSDCATPLVTFTIDQDATAADFAELTKVVKGRDTDGTHYQYYHTDVRNTWLPTDAIIPYCKAECGTPNPPPSDPAIPFACGRYGQLLGNCGGYRDSCENLKVDTDGCEAYRLEMDYRVRCLGCDPSGDCTGVNHPTGDLARCRYNQENLVFGECGWSGVYQNNSDTCYALLKRQKSYCMYPATCEADCEAFYANHQYGASYVAGRLQDLNHNIIEIDDAQGRVIIKNVYGLTPTSINFDRVVDQQWGASDHVRFEYHDFSLEAQYPYSTWGAAAPSIQDNVNVTTLASFVSFSICPNCTDSNCDAMQVDDESQNNSQTPRYATVVHDLYGVTRVQYYSAGWNLLREVNESTNETTNYNYHFGFVTGVARPAGDRTCTVYADNNLPQYVFQMPAPGYGGDQTTRRTFIAYNDQLTYPSEIRQDLSPGVTTDTQISWTGDGRPLIIDTTADGVTRLTTVYSYGSYFFPDTITKPNGSIVTYSNPDPNTNLPTVMVAGLPSDGDTKQTTWTYDSFWGNVQQETVFDASGSVAFSSTANIRDPSTSRILTAGRWTYPFSTLNWDQTSFSYINSDQPTTLTDARKTQYLDYDSNNTLIKSVQVPLDASQKARLQCSIFGADGRLLQTLNPEGDSTIYTYDGAGRVTSIQRGYDPNRDTYYWPSGCDVGWPTPNLPNPPAGDPGLETVAAYTYGPGGFPISMTRAGVTYTIATDGFGRVIETRDGAGVVNRKGYDKHDRVIWEAVYQDQGSGIPSYNQPSFGDAGLASAVETAYD